MPAVHPLSLRTLRGSEFHWQAQSPPELSRGQNQCWYWEQLRIAIRPSLLGSCDGTGSYTATSLISLKVNPLSRPAVANLEHAVLVAWMEV